MIRFFRGPVRGVVKSKFHFSWDDMSAVKGPFLLVSNHNNDWDPVMLADVMPEPMYFVASEHIARKPAVAKLLTYYFNPILHTKGKSAIGTTLEMIRRLKDGYNVAIFPEGNRSFNGVTGPVIASTSKIAKKTGVSLVTVRFEGGYLTTPRWSLKNRKGRLHLHLVHIYTPEEIGAMTDSELSAAMTKDLWEDAYASQTPSPIRFKGRRLAEGLEAAAFVCPVCHKIGSLQTRRNRVSCSCGFFADYDEYGYLNTPDGSSFTVTDWDTLQREVLEDRLREAKASESAGAEASPLFSDTVELLELDDSHKVVSAVKGTLAGFSESFRMNGEALCPFHTSSVACTGRNKLVMTDSETHKTYEIKGSQQFCALKYYYLYLASRSPEGKIAEE